MRVTDLYRHPIKSHGYEAIKTVRLQPNKAMPFDRIWAVTHKKTKFNFDTPKWISCCNFSIGSGAPQLMAITARMDENKYNIHLSHPNKPDLCVNLNIPHHQRTFIEWVRPLIPPNRPQPSAVVHLFDRAITDTEYPSISINSHSTNRVISSAAGMILSPLRWRGNIWIDDLDPWEEFKWIGKKLRVGTVIIKIKACISRCNATKVNPKSGKIDVDTLGILKSHWGQQDFGIYSTVVGGGTINIGDAVTIL